MTALDFPDRAINAKKARNQATVGTHGPFLAGESVRRAGVLDFNDRAIGTKEARDRATVGTKGDGLAGKSVRRAGVLDFPDRRISTKKARNLATVGTKRMDSQANLYVEPGFWTLLMASVAARAIKVQGLGLRFSNFGSRVQGPGSRIWCLA